MTLLITAIAAVITTFIWYRKNDPSLKLHLPMFMFWGASLMWLVDALFEYAELRGDYFTPSVQDMVNDSFLGLSVVALTLVIWVTWLLISDPKGVIKEKLSNRK